MLLPRGATAFWRGHGDRARGSRGPTQSHCAQKAAGGSGSDFLVVAPKVMPTF